MSCCLQDTTRLTPCVHSARKQDLGIGDSVDWCINVPFAELKALLGGAVGGLHTMEDEHFGIRRAR